VSSVLGERIGDVANGSATTCATHVYAGGGVDSSSALRGCIRGQRRTSR